MTRKRKPKEPRVDRRRRTYPPLTSELQQLCVAHDWLVKELVLRLGTWRAKMAGIEVEDLLQAGRMGLLLAARRYDPSKGLQFNTLARHAVMGQMLECIEKARFGKKNSHKQLIDQSQFKRLQSHDSNEDDPWT